jgi:hypothetical protein
MHLSIQSDVDNTLRSPQCYEFVSRTRDMSCLLRRKREAFTNHACRERRNEAVSTKGIYTEHEQQEFCEPFEILPHPNDIQRETARAVIPPLDYFE